MNLNLKYLYPLIVFLPIVFLDRLASFEIIRKIGSKGINQQSVLIHNTENILNKLAQETESQQSRNIIFLGSSRSIPFYYVNEDLSDNEFLPEEAKLKMRKYNFNSSLSIAQIDMITLLSLADGIENSSFYPNLIVIEASEFLFNEKLSEQRWAQAYHSNDFIFKYFSILPPNLKLDSITRFLFTSYRYRIHFETVVKKLAARNLSYEEMPIFTEEQQLMYFNYLRDNSYHKQGFLSEKEKKEFIGYAQLIKQNGMMKDFYAGPHMFEIFLKIVEMFKKKNIDVIIWLPPVHETYQAQINDPYEFSRTFWPAYYEMIKNTGVPFYNGDEILKSCPYWRDTSHLAQICYSVLGYELLKQSGKL
ncbi:MAG: DUF1574 domain-containing protein [Spirochaetia bacterium]|nr:DUF1574 domain-containing protein [Spirochaetia bacterium]